MNFSRQPINPDVPANSWSSPLCHYPLPSIRSLDQHQPHQMTNGPSISRELHPLGIRQDFTSHDVVGSDGNTGSLPPLHDTRQSPRSLPSLGSTIDRRVIPYDPNDYHHLERPMPSEGLPSRSVRQTRAVSSRRVSERSSTRPRAIPTKRPYVPILSGGLRISLEGC